MGEETDPAVQLTGGMRTDRGRSYIPRLIDSTLEFALSSKGAVRIMGPKACGKKTAAMRFAKSFRSFQNGMDPEQDILLAKTDPQSFLTGETPMLIDEWQIVPRIWNVIRYEVDCRGEFGQFILTGSAAPDEKEMMMQHSGVGRIRNLMMRPMTLYESGESTGAVSLKGLFDGAAPKSAESPNALKDYAFFTARGGWPSSVGRTGKAALQQAREYVGMLEGPYLRSATGAARDPERIGKLLRSYARSCGTQANRSAMRKNIEANDGGSLSEDTIGSYIDALKSVYVLEDSPAWDPYVRSKAAVRTSDTRYFVDPSLACASLGLGPDGLMSDIRTFGPLFENLCIRDLRVYSDLIDGSVRHFRNSKGLEADVVITLRNGSWAALEVKLGGQEFIDEGAKNLLKVAADYGAEGRPPAFLAVITATDYAYRRDDGVWVIPLGCLGP